MPRKSKAAAPLHTRQLRRKEGSFKKISEMTQMLLTPITELTPKVRVRRSPKEMAAAAEKRDSEVGKNSAKEQVSVAGADASTDTRTAERRKRKRKRKAEAAASTAAAESVGVPAARAVAAGSGNEEREVEVRMSVRQLVELADAGELQDDDLLEILTCDSPVWWEDPPDLSYSEEPICSKTLYADRYEDMTNCNPLPLVSISLPDTKHIDYKFMKKRLKLENLLGNLKTKIHNENGNNTNQPIIQCKTELDKNDKEIDEKITVDNNQLDKETISVKEAEKGEVKRVKKTSESSEVDSVLGFNEDLLRDLENMDIPIETDGKDANIKAQLDKDSDAISKNSQDVDMISVTESDNVNDTVAVSTSNVCFNVISQSDASKMETEEKNSEKVVSSQINTPDAVSIVSNTASNTVSDTIHRSSSSPTNVPDSDIQESSSQNSVVNDKIKSDTMFIKEHESDAVLDKNCDKNSEVCGVIQESPVAVTNISNSSNNNSKGGINLAENPNKNIVKTGNHDKSNKDNDNALTKNDNVVSNKITEDSVPKNDTSIKGTNHKTNKLNKEQLMAVYKTIIDTGYAQNLNESTKSETANPNAVIMTDTNSENMATFYKKCKNMKRAVKNETTPEEASDTNENVDIIDKTENPTKVDAKQENSDDKNKCCNCILKSGGRNINFSRIPDCKSAKYCLKCSSIFETDTCCYCEKKLQSEAPCQSCKV